MKFDNKEFYYCMLFSTKKFHPVYAMIVKNDHHLVVELRSINAKQVSKYFPAIRVPTIFSPTKYNFSACHYLINSWTITSMGKKLLTISHRKIALTDRLQCPPRPIKTNKQGMHINRRRTGKKLSP